MSSGTKEVRQGNTPTSNQNAYEETLRKQDFPNRKIEGQQAEEQGAMRVQAAREASSQQDDCDNGFPNRQPNAVHTKHPEANGPFIQREPIKK